MEVSGGTQIHVGVAVDDWICHDGKWYKVGEKTFDFGPEQSLINIIKLILPMKGTIKESYGMHLKLLD